jgi:hypothetical protein
MRRGIAHFRWLPTFVLIVLIAVAGTLPFAMYGWARIVGQIPRPAPFVPAIRRLL